ncbi:MAG: hypothetical protein JW776_05975 [Candidatus Lokiarchaeota archaeon]|nr:hypothetical protein [Candidatus Lokiarchaeota archaeon]
MNKIKYIELDTHISIYWILFAFTYQNFLFLEVWTVNGWTIVYDSLYIVIPFIISLTLGIIFSYIQVDIRILVLPILILITSMLILVGNLFQRLKMLNYIGCYAVTGWICSMNYHERSNWLSYLYPQHILIISFILILFLPMIRVFDGLLNWIILVPFIILGVLLIINYTLRIKLYPINKAEDLRPKKYKGFQPLIRIVLLVVLNFLCIYSTITINIYAQSIWRMILSSCILIAFLIALFLFPRRSNKILIILLFILFIWLGLAQSLILDGTFRLSIILSQTLLLFILWIDYSFDELLQIA